MLNYKLTVITCQLSSGGPERWAAGWGTMRQASQQRGFQGLVSRGRGSLADANFPDPAPLPGLVVAGRAAG